MPDPELATPQIPQFQLLSTIEQISAALQANAQFGSFSQQIAHQLASLPGMPQESVCLLAEVRDNKTLRFIASSPVEVLQRLKAPRTGLDLNHPAAGTAGYAAQQRRSIYTPASVGKETHGLLPDMETQLAVPLMQGKVCTGVIVIGCPQVNALPIDVREEIEHLAPGLSVALEYHPETLSRREKFDPAMKIVRMLQEQQTLNRSFRSVNRLFTPFEGVVRSKAPVDTFYETLKQILPDLCSVTGAEVGMLLCESRNELHFEIAHWVAELPRPKNNTYTLSEDAWETLSAENGVYVGNNVGFAQYFTPALPFQNWKHSEGDNPPEIAVMLIGTPGDSTRSILILGNRKTETRGEQVNDLTFKEQISLFDFVARRLGEIYSNALNTRAYQHFMEDVMHQLYNSFGSLVYAVENLREGNVPVEDYPAAFQRLYEIVNLFRYYIETGNLAAQSRSIIEVYGDDEFKLFDAPKLVDALERNREYFLGRARHYGIQGPIIRTETFRHLPTIKVHPRLLDLVIFNLFDNAVKYTLEDANLPITVEGGVEGDWVTISFTNHGIPLHEEDIRRVFDRYMRSEEAVHHASFGTGIGLSLCQEILHKHGGEIVVTPSEPSPLHTLAEQVTFTIRLPGVEQARKRTTTVQPISTKPTIMWVEDDPYPMDDLRKNLEMDFEIVFARNTRQAFSQLAARRDDIKLILLDIILKDRYSGSDMDAEVAGIDFARTVLHEWKLNLPIIVHTAKAAFQPHIIAELRGIGVTEIVQKGSHVTGAELKRMIRKLIST
ncbi:MAG: ATP-binding protein [bacterium]|nr:ATP-binding protein [bacterium]